MSEFHFLRPWWLLALLPLGLLLWHLLRAHGGGDAWRKVVDAHLLPRLLSGGDAGARRLPWWLLGLGWLLLVLALAGPTWERLPEPMYQARQFRVIVLDLSPSMNATDLAPSRLGRARFEVLDLLRQSSEGQTALLAYGAEPYVVAPLTTDVETIAAQVPHLETALLPVAGARRADLALEQAGELLRQAEAPDGQVILITDELGHAAAAGAAAQRLRAAGYRVSVLGIGTSAGAPVAAPDGGFLKDETGAIRLPRLDLAGLRALADAGGGVYVTASPDDRDIQALRGSGPTLAGGQVGDERAEADRWREQGPWLLLLLLPLAALAFRRGWLSPLLLLVFMLPPPDAHALSWNGLWLRPDQQATRLLEDGRSQEAAQVFQRPDWRAAAQYRASDYEQALASLQDLDGADADYNRGNALARLGRLEDAVAAYDRALAGNPDDVDARHNRNLVQRLLERARQQRERDDQPSEQAQQDQQAQAGAQGAEDQQQQQQAGEQGADDPQQGSQQAEAQQAEGTQDQQQSAAGSDPGSEQAGEQQAQAQGSQRAQDEQAGSGQTAGDGQDPGSQPQGSQQADAQGSAVGQQDQQAASEQDHNGAPDAQQSAQEQAPEGEQTAQQRGAGEDPGDGQQQTHADQPQAADAQGKMPRQQDAQQAGQGGQPDGHSGDGGQQTADAQARAEAGAPPGGDPVMPRAAAPAPESKAPGLTDLLGDQPRMAEGAQATGTVPGMDAEDRQAVEQMLRRVEDDPAGLLRQRFLLQHLRRSGRLP